MKTSLRDPSALLPCVRQKLPSMTETGERSQLSSSNPHSMRMDREHPQLSSSEIADLWEHACLLYHSYEWQSAANAFSELEGYTSDPGDRCIFALNRGLIEARLGDFELAFESFTKALEFEDDNAVAHFLLGLVHAETGNHEGAKAHFQQCLDNLDTHSHYYRTHVDTFDLDRFDVEDNVNRLQSVMATTAEGYGRIMPLQVRLRIIPADYIFEAPSRSGHTSPTSARSSTEFNPDGEPDNGADDSLRDPFSGASQVLETAEQDISSLHHIEDGDMEFTIPPASPEIDHTRQHKRLLPRDAQVRDESTKDLAQFIRHAGPSENANVTVDRKYMQRLLQGNTGKRNVLDFFNRDSTASSAIGVPTSLLGQEDDFESLLGLYTETRTKRRSFSTTVDSFASEATVTRQAASPDQTTSNGVDAIVTNRKRPPGSRRPTLETAQRWLRKEVRPPWPYKLATSERKHSPRSSRDQSRGALSNDGQSLPSVASSTEMFTFGKPGRHRRS